MNPPLSSFKKSSPKWIGVDYGDGLKYCPKFPWWTSTLHSFEFVICWTSPFFSLTFLVSIGCPREMLDPIEFLLSSLHKGAQSTNLLHICLFFYMEVRNVSKVLRMEFGIMVWDMVLTSLLSQHKEFLSWKVRIFFKFRRCKVHINLSMKLVCLFCLWCWNLPNHGNPHHALGVVENPLMSKGCTKVIL